jgi:Flp pilus assembly pilin Flp
VQILNTIAIKSIATANSVKARLAANEDGASSVEWVLIVAGIAAVVTAGVTIVGTFFTGKVNSL